MRLFSFSSLFFFFPPFTFCLSSALASMWKLSSNSTLSKPASDNVHPAVPQKALVHVCAEGTCLSSAHCLIMKGSRYVAWATLYQCRAEQVVGWKPPLPSCVYVSDTHTDCAGAVKAHLSDSTGLRTVCVCTTLWAHAFTPVWTILVGRMEVGHTRCSAFCVCAAPLCVYTLMSTSDCARAHTHTHRVRDRAIKRLFTEIPHTPLVHWFNFKAMRTIAEKIKVL